MTSSLLTCGMLEGSGVAYFLSCSELNSDKTWEIRLQLNKMLWHILKCFIFPLPLPEVREFLLLFVFFSFHIHCKNQVELLEVKKTNKQCGAPFISGYFWNF